MKTPMPNEKEINEWNERVTKSTRRGFRGDPYSTHHYWQSIDKTINEKCVRSTISHLRDLGRTRV